MWGPVQDGNVSSVWGWARGYCPILDLWPDSSNHKMQQLQHSFFFKQKLFALNKWFKCIHCKTCYVPKGRGAALHSLHAEGPSVYPQHLQHTGFWRAFLCLRSWKLLQVSDSVSISQVVEICDPPPQEGQHVSRQGSWVRLWRRKITSWWQSIWAKSAMTLLCQNPTTGINNI